MADVRDILELEQPVVPEITKESILSGADKLKKKPGPTKGSKRPEGMHREVFALLYSDNKDAPPLFPTTTDKGYKQIRAKLGMRKVRSWEWVPFTNPARSDKAVFHHWRRVSDDNKEYPFAKFNKQVPIPQYSDAEYAQHLHSDGWTRAETDHLFDLCRRFDLRFIVIHDRWDRSQFADRSVEDLKERYYGVCGVLSKIQAATSHEAKLYVFDADHERRRKEQLKRLYDRTPEQVEEEQMLLSELRRIETRKKERERKQQDLQKLITAADSQAEARKSDKKVSKKKMQQVRPRLDTVTVETAGIKFPDYKSSVVALRSQRMKLPANVGQKKIKNIEQMLQGLCIVLIIHLGNQQPPQEYAVFTLLEKKEANPIPTEEVCHHFNELRSDMVLLHELKSALENCEYELHALRHHYEAANPGKTLQIPAKVFANSDVAQKIMPVATFEAAKQPRASSEIIDVVGISPGVSSVT
ncbi:DNA methyltransferase 1-associated protein 1 isoform X2 [Bacillus rossius redtenbacheri]